MISLDSLSSVFTGVTTNPITQSFTNVSGTLLLVGISIADLTTSVTVTYNGVAMTITPNGANSYAQAGTNFVRNTIFYLDRPAIGANNLVITRNTSTTAISYQIASYAGAEGVVVRGTSASGASGSPPSSDSVTTTVPNCWLFGFIQSVSGSFSNSTNFTFRGGAASFGLYDSNADIGIAGVKTVTFAGGSAQWSDQLIAFAGISLQTNAITSISTMTAVANGDITSDNGSTITERGFVWATTTTPTTSNSKASTAGTLGVYSVSMTGLAPNTLYYVRGYYINGLGTTYGNQVTFTTLNIDQYTIQRDIGATTGQTFMGQINVAGTVGTVTVKLGTTGTATVIAAGAGTTTFTGTYSGLSGLIITRSATFNGTIDNVFYAQVPLLTPINWTLDSVTIISAINSSVFFKRIEDDVFNSFRFYRYLDLLFKNLNGYVTVTVRDEREDITTERTKIFSVGNTGTGTVSPFQKKRISFLIKNQAVIIGLSNGNIGETFSIAQFLLTGSKKPQRTFAPSKIQSM